MPEIELDPRARAEYATYLLFQAIGEMTAVISDPVARECVDRNDVEQAHSEIYKLAQFKRNQPEAA